MAAGMNSASSRQSAKTAKKTNKPVTVRASAKKGSETKYETINP